MFGKKKKKQVVETVTEKFEIPQIISPYQGIKQSKDGFKPAKMGSSIFGTGTKDKATYVEADLGDIRWKYDSFRAPEDKKVSDEELIATRGSKFPEFNHITLDTAKEVYGEEISISKKTSEPFVEKDNKPTFSFIQSATDFVKDEKKVEDNQQVEQKPGFNFNIDEGEDEITPKEDSFDFTKFKPEPQEEKQQPQDYFNGHFNKNGEFSNSNTSIVRKQSGYNTKLFNTNKVTGTDENKIDVDEDYMKNYNENSKTQNIESDYNSEEQAPVYNEPIYKAPEQKIEEYKPESNDGFNFEQEEDSNSNEEVSYIEPETFEMPIIINPYKDYTLPPISLLAHGEAEENDIPADVEDKKEIINGTLESFGINGSVEKYVVGPTFTRFEILLETGVNVKKVVNLQDNFQMNLGVSSIRIQAPIPGKKTVGIEVPNDKRKSVSFGDTITEEFINDGKPLNVAVGKDIDGNIIYSNIAKWPHGLIAGSTGSGKSVCINTVIVSMLLKCKPDEVKFIMVDPKQVELSIYNDIPHLITPVISDPKMASEALKWAVNEMERRFTMFTSVRARDMESYNEKVKDDPTLQKMPFIVIIIDELADLMMQCSQDVEASIQRITQKARAAGIHLICATQRPTVDVVKGTIKANIQARLAFRVNSQTDSLTILDEVGAESLLGKGDMLLKEVDMPKRVQGSFIPDEEIDAVVDYICNEAKPNYLFTHQDLKSNEEGQGFAPLNSETESVQTIYEIACWCCENKTCSINSIQQNFQLGFNRAQKIVTALEEAHIVSEKKGTKRDILMNLQQIKDYFEIED